MNTEHLRALAAAVADADHAPYEHLMGGIHPYEHGAPTGLQMAIHAGPWHDPGSDTGCGTACCLLGWAAWLSGEIEARIEDPERVVIPHDIAGAAGRYLEMWHPELDALGYPWLPVGSALADEAELAPRWTRIRPAQAAAVCRRLADLGEGGRAVTAPEIQGLWTREAGGA